MIHKYSLPLAKWSLHMAIKSHKTTNVSKPNLMRRRVLPPLNLIANEATKIESLIRELVLVRMGLKAESEDLLSQSSKLQNLNSFGKQLIIQMMRSNPNFRGFKIDIKDHILRPDILFLVGTLCSDFGHMNTSPLFGCKILDVGCGALSAYAPSEEDDDLITQFYRDYPPLNAEILQILGAQVTGIDPREHSKDRYEYQVSYKHRTVEFSDIHQWFAATEDRFDILTCFHLFNKSSFLYTFDSPKAIAKLFRSFRKVLAPGGLLYCVAPFLPISAQQQQANYQIFRKAGFKVLYSGYYYILVPIDPAE